MPAMPLPATTRRVRRCGRGRFDAHAAVGRRAWHTRSTLKVGSSMQRPLVSAEVMLVDRRCDDALALQIAGEAARQHVGPARRVEVVERVDVAHRTWNSAICRPPTSAHTPAPSMSSRARTTSCQRASLMRPPRAVAFALLHSRLLARSSAWPDGSARAPRRTPRCRPSRPSSRSGGSA